MVGELNTPLFTTWKQRRNFIIGLDKKQKVVNRQDASKTNTEE